MSPRTRAAKRIPLLAHVQGVDLLVHAAGPFQRRTECNVLEACIAAGVPYMDVCDDADYTQRAKRLHQKCAPSGAVRHCCLLTAWLDAGNLLAHSRNTHCRQSSKIHPHCRARDAGVPAITSTGIYPGTSNLMAAHMISTARKVSWSLGRRAVASSQAQPNPADRIACPGRGLRPSRHSAGHMGSTLSRARLQEYNHDGTLRDQPGEGAVQPARLRYSYYTAGSGGVGPTILETSMLLAGEEVVAYRDGQKASAGLELYCRGAAELCWAQLFRKNLKVLISTGCPGQRGCVQWRAIFAMSPFGQGS
jgi:Saccharopine dehydrogenase NADP binding domain